MPLNALLFPGQNWHTEIAGLNALDDAELQHLHDLLDRRAELQRRPDVAAGTGGAYMCV